jgi:hypothetical protein
VLAALGREGRAVGGHHGVGQHGQVVLVVGPCSLHDRGPDAQPFGGGRQGGQPRLGGDPLGEDLLTGNAVVGQPGPAEHRGQGQALDEQRRQDDTEGDQHDQVEPGDDHHLQHVWVLHACRSSTRCGGLARRLPPAGPHNVAAGSSASPVFGVPRPPRAESVP